MDVLFLHGPPAVGKHTVGTLLASLVDMPMFHNHLIVDAVSALFEFGSPGFVCLRQEMWLASFRVAVDENESFIFTFNPEATVDPALIGYLVEVVESRGGRVHFVELTCSEATIFARLGEPSRAQFGKMIDPKLYQTVKQANGFDYPPLPTPIIVVQTDTQAPIESAHDIAAAYKALA